MKAPMILSITALLLTSACNRRPHLDYRAQALVMQTDADLTADAHMSLYQLLPADDTQQSAQARLIVLILLDGYQSKKAFLEAPPFNYVYPPASRAADVADFLNSHEAERQKYTAALEAERATIPRDDSSRRVRVVPQ